MAENDAEKSEANVSEGVAERPAPELRKWRKDKGSDGLKMRTLRAMKAAEEMMYSAETRAEAAEGIKLLTQASQAHRRVLRDEHRKEVELNDVLTQTQIADFAREVAASAQQVFERFDVPDEAQQVLADRIGGAAVGVQQQLGLLEE